MNFHFLSLFRKRDIPELLERALVAETRAAVLENVLEKRERRARRERRKDATDIARAISARAKEYSDRFSRLTPEQAQEARMRAGRRT